MLEDDTFLFWCAENISHPRRLQPLNSAAAHHPRATESYPHNLASACIERKVGEQVIYRTDQVFCSFSTTPEYSHRLDIQEIVVGGPKKLLGEANPSSNRDRVAAPLRFIQFWTSTIAVQHLRLFVRDRRTARTRQMKDFVMIEPGFLTPLPEIDSAKIERVAKFDKHIKRHQ